MSQRERRKAAFQRVALLRKKLESFDMVMVHLQREHAKIYDCISVLRRTTDEERRALEMAIGQLDEVSIIGTRSTP